MRLYLDDDSVGRVLIRLLQKAGHDVRLPADIGKAGSADSVHLRYAIREGRGLLTHNCDDFNLLHDLILEAGGHHAGILVVHKHNNPRRDLKATGIVRALAKLRAANAPVADEYIVLNHWR